jgi:hypothetical protein
MEQDRLREYWYYSDRKIKRLASQIRPPGWRRALDNISAFEVKALEVGVGIETRPPELEAEVLRLLQRVIKKLDQQKAVGTFDDPKGFFYGQLEFYYGAPYTGVDPPAFFLAGATDRTVIGLGGSLEHVRSYRDRQVRAAENATMASMEPDIAAVIHDTELRTSDALAEDSAVIAAGTWATHVAGIYHNWDGQHADKLDFEVLAAREGKSTVSQPFWESPRQVVIGSPIFVAFT